MSNKIVNIDWDVYETYPPKHSVLFEDRRKKVMTARSIVKWYKDNGITVPQTALKALEEEERIGKELNEEEEKRTQREILAQQKKWDEEDLRKSKSWIVQIKWSKEFVYPAKHQVTFRDQSVRDLTTEEIISIYKTESLTPPDIALERREEEKRIQEILEERGEM